MFIVTNYLLPHNKIFKSWPFVKAKEEMKVAQLQNCSDNLLQKFGICQYVY